MLRKLLCCLPFVFVVTACSTTSVTRGAHAPNVDVTETRNVGPYSDDKGFEVDTKSAYKACMKELQGYIPKDPSDPRYSEMLFQIEQRCYSRASAGGTNLGMGFGSGIGLGYGLGPGMAMAPVEMSGLPGAMPAFPMRGPGQISMEQSPVAMAPAMMPGMAAPASGSSDDTALIVREQARQHKRLCEIEKSQGRPCK